MSRMFGEKHSPRVGIVTNQPDGYDRAQPHAATDVCGRQECQEKARFWVQGTTGQTAVLILDSDQQGSE